MRRLHWLFHFLVGFSPEPEEQPFADILELSVFPIYDPKDSEMKQSDIDAINSVFGQLYKRIGELTAANADLASKLAAHTDGAVSMDQVNAAIAAALDAQPSIDLTKVPGYVAPVDTTVAVDTGTVAAA